MGRDCQRHWAIGAAIFAAYQAKAARSQAADATVAADAARRQVSLLLRQDERDMQRLREERMPQIRCSLLKGNMKVSLDGPDDLAWLNLAMRTSDGRPLPIQFSETEGSSIELGQFPVGRTASVPYARVGDGGAELVLDFEFLGAEGPHDQPGKLVQKLRVHSRPKIIAPSDDSPGRDRCTRGF